MSKSTVLLSDSPEQTRALGAALAERLVPGDVLYLIGDLGAGKTTLVKAVAQALGVEELVVSPTFVLVRPYQGRKLKLVHVDAFRLEPQDIPDLGLEEASEDGVLVVEWADRVSSELPAPTVVVRILPGTLEQERIVTLEHQEEDRRFEDIGGVLRSAHSGR